jgi:hypothetical protein
VSNRRLTRQGYTAYPPDLQPLLVAVTLGVRVGLFAGSFVLIDRLDNSTSPVNGLSSQQPYPQELSGEPGSATAAAASATPEHRNGDQNRGGKSQNNQHQDACPRR